LSTSADAVHVSHPAVPLRKELWNGPSGCRQERFPIRWACDAGRLLRRKLHVIASFPPAGGRPALDETTRNPPSRGPAAHGQVPWGKPGPIEPLLVRPIGGPRLPPGQRLMLSCVPAAFLVRSALRDEAEPVLGRHIAPTRGLAMTE
jgi:hypothetical protein